MRKWATDEGDCSLLEARQYLLRRNRSGLTISHLKFSIFFYSHTIFFVDIWIFVLALECVKSISHFYLFCFCFIWVWCLKIMPFIYVNSTKNAKISSDCASLITSFLSHIHHHNPILIGIHYPPLNFAGNPQNGSLHP